MSSIKVVVRKSHITRGVPQEPLSCPIALALKERLHRRVDVGGETVTIYRNGTERTLPLPEAARNFVDTFDGNGAKAVKPFRFTLTDTLASGVDTAV